MKITTILTLTVVLALGFVGTSSAQLYKWTDENGVVNVTNTPPPDNVKAEVRDYPDYNVESTPVPQVRSYSFDGAGNPEVEQKEEKAFNGVVKLYTTSWCPSCKTAKKWLRANGVKYKELDVEKSRSAEKEFRALGLGGSIPVAVIGGKNIVGFNEAAYRKALGM